MSGFIARRGVFTEKGRLFEVVGWFWSKGRAPRVSLEDLSGKTSFGALGDDTSSGDSKRQNVVMGKRGRVNVTYFPNDDPYPWLHPKTITVVLACTTERSVLRLRDTDIIDVNTELVTT